MRCSIEAGQSRCGSRIGKSASQSRLNNKSVFKEISGYLELEVYLQLLQLLLLIELDR